MKRMDTSSERPWAMAANSSAETTTGLMSKFERSSVNDVNNQCHGVNNQCHGVNNQCHNVNNQCHGVNYCPNELTCIIQ